MTNEEELRNRISGKNNPVVNSNQSLISQYPNLFTPMPFEQPAPMEIPKMEMPAIPSPSLVDMGRVSQLTQQFASPAIRSGRAGLREMLARGSRDNPIQQSYRARGAIAGMGDVINAGIANARSPSLSVATGEAASQGDINKLGYESALNTNKLAYENAWNTNKMAYESTWKKNLMAYEDARRLRELEISQRRDEQTYQRLLAEQSRQSSLSTYNQPSRDAYPSLENRRYNDYLKDVYAMNSSGTYEPPQIVYGNPDTPSIYKDTPSSSGWGDDESSGSIKINGEDYSNSGSSGSIYINGKDYSSGLQDYSSEHNQYAK